MKADRKPLARYGAMEGALARSLLTPAGQTPIDNDRRAEPTAPHCRRHQPSRAPRRQPTDSALTHAQDFTMRLTPTKFENIIDLATRGEPPLVAGFRS